MIDEGRPDTVIACPGGAGTLEINRAVAAGIPVIEIRRTAQTYTAIKRQRSPA